MCHAYINHLTLTKLFIMRNKNNMTEKKNKFQMRIPLMNYI